MIPLSLIPPLCSNKLFTHSSLFAAGPLQAAVRRPSVHMTEALIHTTAIVEGRRQENVSCMYGVVVSTNQ